MAINNDMREVVISDNKARQLLYRKYCSGLASDYSCRCEMYVNYPQSSDKFLTIQYPHILPIVILAKNDVDETHSIHRQRCML